MNVIGYIRVSTQEQADSGLGLAAQEKQLWEQAQVRGWTLLRIETDPGVSGAEAWQRRPGLSRALTALKNREAGGLIVAKVDRLARSVAEFAAIMELSKRQDWSLAFLDLGVDTSTPGGQFVANVMASVAQLERQLISTRTREAMAVKIAAGFHMGRRSTLARPLIERILRERMGGLTYAEIATGLDRDEIATGQGAKRWSKQAVYEICRRESRVSQPRPSTEPSIPRPKPRDMPRVPKRMGRPPKVAV